MSEPLSVIKYKLELGGYNHLVEIVDTGLCYWVPIPIGQELDRIITDGDDLDDFIFTFEVSQDLLSIFAPLFQEYRNSSASSDVISACFQESLFRLFAQLFETNIRPHLNNVDQPGFYLKA